MKAQALKTFDIVSSIAKAEEIILNRLTNTAWKIAYTALWNGKNFTRTEIQKAKAIICEFLLSNQTIEKAMEEFTQRVLLARNYIANNPGKHISIPSEWLNKDNRAGFAATAKWFSGLQQKREEMPDFLSEWRDFTWAIWQINGKAADRYFHEWRTYFAEKNQPMLNLFLATVANSCGWLRDEATVLLYKLS